MDHPSGPLSAEEHDRVETLVDRFVQNYERLHQSVMLTGMELTLLSPHVSDQEDGVEVLRALRAVGVHLTDGYHLHVHLLRDLDEVLAMVDGTA